MRKRGGGSAGRGVGKGRRGECIRLLPADEVSTAARSTMARTYNDIGLDFGGDDRVLVNLIASGEVRFSVSKDLAVELTLSSRQVRALLITFHHGHEGGIPRRAAHYIS